MALIFNAIFSSVAYGHFGVDLLNGTRAVLLAFLSKPLGMSNTTLGLFSTIYVVFGSLTQPIFGYLTDRIGPRWVVTGGVFWMALFYSTALVVPGQSTLWFLILGSLGSACFHPAGTMQATLVGRNYFHGRETTASAYFFFYGQAGLFLGPILAGPILDRYESVGLVYLALILLPIGINAAYQLRLVGLPTTGHKDTNPNKRKNFPKINPLIFAAFALMAALQAWAQQNMVTFLPKHLADLGLSASRYGLVSALFMAGSAFGNMFGGNLADRFGKQRVTATSLALASIPLFLTSQVGGSSWLYLLVPLAGGLTGAVHSIIVVSAQRLIPGGMGLASGLILGFMFSSGALGTMLSGYLADRVGFPTVFMTTALIVLAASFLALWIKPPERRLDNLA